MGTEELLRARFTKHPEKSVNGNTSLDDELISLISDDPDLDRIFNTDFDKCMDSKSTYL